MCAPCVRRQVRLPPRSAPTARRLLGDYQGSGGTIHSELLELVSALYNGEMRPVRRPADDTDIGQMIPYRRVSFGLDAMELKDGQGTDFAAILSLKDYPDATSPGLLDGLLRMPFEMVVSESFAPSERQTSRERMDLALRRLRSADEEARAERADMMAARDELGAGAVGFGDHHLTVLIRERDLARLDDASTSCAAALADTGAIAVREDTNLEPAFWGQFPGNEGYLVRRAMISTANMASFGSLHGFALGQASDNHWGDAVTLLETTSATPFFFNFHNGDLGNFSIIGPSGSGKTVVMNFLVAQAQKFSPRTILFDKDRGAELFVRGIGGRYDRIAAGVPTGFNPLALPDSAINRAFLRDWLGVLLKAEGPEELGTISAAVDAAYANDPSLRRLRHFKELLAGARRPQPGDLADRLAAWIDSGEHGWLFDNARRPARPLGPGARLRHDRAARKPAPAHAGDDVSVPPDRRAARRPADDDPDRRGLEGARRRSLRRAHPRLAQDPAQAQCLGRLRDTICARCARKPHFDGAGRTDRDDDLHAQRPCAGGGLLRGLRTHQPRAGVDPVAPGAQPLLPRPPAGRFGGGAAEPGECTGGFSRSSPDAKARCAGSIACARRSGTIRPNGTRRSPAMHGPGWNPRTTTTAATPMPCGRRRNDRSASRRSPISATASAPRCGAWTAWPATRPSSPSGACSARRAP